MSRNKKEDDLLKAIQGTRPSSAASKNSGKTTSPKQISSSSTKGRRSRTSSFSFNEEDYRLLRELSAWLAGQGKRVNDTAILRALLRMAETGDELLNAYEMAEEEIREARRRDVAN